MYFLYQPLSVPRKILDLYWKKNLNPVLDIQISIKYLYITHYTLRNMLLNRLLNSMTGSFSGCDISLKSKPSWYFSYIQKPYMLYRYKCFKNNQMFNVVINGGAILYWIDWYLNSLRIKSGLFYWSRNIGIGQDLYQWLSPVPNLFE